MCIQYEYVANTSGPSEVNRFKPLGVMRAYMAHMQMLKDCHIWLSFSTSCFATLRLS